MPKPIDLLASDRIHHLILSIVSIACAGAIFVCVICDFAITGSLSWSLYPIGSLLFSWLVAFPAMKLKKGRIVGSLAVFSLLIIPFLFFLEWVTPVGGWVLPLGLPSACLAVAYAWAAFLLFLKTPLRKWYAAAIAALLTIPVSYLVNEWSAAFAGESLNPLQHPVNLILTLCVAAVFFFVGLMTRKKAA